MATDWIVHPHHPMVPLAENLWMVTGSLPRMALPRNALIYRRDDGSLAIHSPVALIPTSMTVLDSFGPVKLIIVPNGLHRYDAPRFADRYPDAAVICPPGATKAVSQVTRVSGDTASWPHAEDLRFLQLNGVSERESVMLVRSEDGITAVVCDAVFNLAHQPGFGGLMLRLVGSSGPPKVTPIARTFLVSDKRALAGSLRELAALPQLVRLIPAHGEPLTGDVAGQLRRVADSLAP